MSNSNESAMPSTAQCERCNQTHNKSEYTSGLSKREHFAGLAMQGLLANSAYYEISTTDLTIESLMLADVLLAELDK